MKIYQVDAFTPQDEEWMLNVAAEMNVSETDFLHPHGDGFNLRWFTPQVEVDLCGHATLASAHILWETERLRVDQKAIFYTRSGTLTAQKSGEWIEMDFPSQPAEPVMPPYNLLDALGVSQEPNYTGRTKFDYLIEVEKEDMVYDLQPAYSQLAKIDTRGVIVTARSNSDCDFVSRFFAPGVGINEDPVTGSAHCSLGPYWSEKLGKEGLIGYQASSRGGVVRVRVGTTDNIVLLGGQAVTVLEGEILY